jgi:Zn-dependent protease
VLVPLVLHFSGSGFLFGWAKPVPVNPANYREYRAGDIRVSLAGIVSNLGLAFLATLATVVVLKLPYIGGPGGGVSAAILDVLEYALVINLVLAIFNLIPIPPLDGSHVLAQLLPPPLAMRYRRFGRFGLLVLMGMMIFFQEAFDYLLWPVTFLRGAADAFIRLWI